jgi:2-octaprenyl-6-methoxyphenol hydroxylase
MAVSGIDVLIHGDGPVGCTLALALAPSGLGIAFAERRAAPERPADAFRPIALSYASRLILERLGVWRMLSPTPIEAIHVSQRGGFGRAFLAAAECGVPALGYVVEYAALGVTLRNAVNERGIGRTAPDTAARCLVHAEGASSEAREKRYAQDALVARVRVTPAAAATAYERFTADGPLALLPYNGSYALVWSTHPERARRLAAAPQAQFLAALQDHTGTRPGVACEVAERSVQPLSLKVRGTRVASRAVYIGNAAQTLHPVAGQGLNLGLRDAWELARIWRDASDPGEPRTLARYANRRRVDIGAAIRITDALASAFLGQDRIFYAARGAALTALDVFPWPRRFFARRMIFGASALP